MGQMKELWIKQVEDIYQDYADGAIGYEEARNGLLDLGVDMCEVIDDLDEIRERGFR